jgi:hypothetical protein
MEQKSKLDDGPDSGKWQVFELTSFIKLKDLFEVLTF